MDLVAGDGNQIRPQGPGPEGRLEKALHRIGVEDRPGAAAVHQLRHFLNGHHRPGLIVHHHDRNKDGVVPQGGVQLLKADPAQRVRRQLRHLEALLPQPLHGMQDRVMLHRGGDDMLSLPAQALCAREHGPVVRLGAAGGEEHPLRLRAHGLGHLAAGQVQPAVRLHAQPMHRRRIAPAVGQHLPDGLNGLGAGPGGGGIVQICDHNSSFSPETGGIFIFRRRIAQRYGP